MKTLTFYNLYKKAVRLVALFSLFFGAASSVNAQLKANFNADPTAGCAPLVVQFSDSSSGNPSSWKWDLGNGTTSVLQNPSVAYFDPGTYTVKLLVKNAYGVDSIAKTSFITVYSSPEINFGADNVTGCFPLTAQFIDSSIAGSGTINQWQWDFGDGNLSSLKNPQHTYSSTGSFNVSLKATNNYGCTTSKTIKNYINIQTGVEAAFSNSTSKSCNAPATINFINNSTGVGTLNYQWNFGDGSSSTQKDPSHTYTVSGTYSVQLIVNNTTGCSDTLIKRKLIIVGNTTADFEIPKLICAETPVIFTNNSNPVPSSASWDFGDGTFSDSVSPVKAFQKAGNYTIKMISNNGACMDSVTKTLTVIQKPVVNFSAPDSVSCAAPFSVRFLNTSSGASNFTANSAAVQTYHWDFGDGSGSDQQNPVHTYTKEGNYTVKLFVTNASGCMDSLVKKAFVQIKKPAITINGLPEKNCAPLTHKFTTSINSLVPITGYHWDFGDGTSSDSVAPTHVFINPGKYTITLICTTADGCVDTVTKVNGIIAGAKPKAAYSADPLDVCAYQKINFSDKSQGNPDQWVWFFGDGGGAINQNPSHLYNDTGYFSITLIAINNGCADTITTHNQVHIHPPVARFIYTKTCTVPREVKFKDNSLGADYWLWNFGDGTTSTEQNPTHAYADARSYEVSLTVTNQASGCSETKTQTVQIIRETADFSVSNAVSCRNAPVTFNAINSIPGHINLYTWKFGDGSSINDSTGSINHSYTKAAPYNVTLILKDVNGCLDSITKPTAVTVNGPTAVFYPGVSGTCLNTSVHFMDSSYTDGTHPIQQYQWNWGDGKTDNFSSGPFDHLYTSSGNYTVSLAVTDLSGCSDTLKKAKAIYISKPIAGFTADTLSCTSEPINFVNSSTGPSLSYVWDFGDGTTSSQKNPVHLYTTEGTYPVSLSIKDKYGCSSNVSKSDFVRIGNPKADFTVSDTIGTCPPLIANFTNNSINYSNLKWDFGDGTSSTEKNPSHFYSTAGTFIARLTVYSVSGCVSEKTQQITVNGPIGVLSYTNSDGCTPLTTSFSAHTKKNTSFVWDFNDGITAATKDSNVVHTYTTPGKYLPKMILQDVNGCKVAITGKDSIGVYGITASFDKNSNLVCDSGTVSFANTSWTNDVIAKSYWNFGDGTVSSAAQPQHFYNRPGSYKTSLKVVTQRGCIDSIVNPQPVIVNPRPKIGISGTAGACVPAVIKFSGTVANPDTSTVSWNWNFANGNASTQQFPSEQTYPSSGNFTVTAIGSSSNGCSDTARKQIDIYPLPSLSIGGDTIVCYGSSQTLSVSGAQTYSWSPAKDLSCNNCATPIAKPDSAITYQVKGTSSKGCVSFDSVSLVVKYPFKLSFSKPDTLCLGRSVQLFASGTEKYSWFPSTGLNDAHSSSPTASPVTTTTYQVIGSDEKGCFSDTAYVPVKVFPIPEVNAGVDQTIAVGNDLQIVPKISDDVTSVEWMPTTGIVSQNYPSIIVKPTQSIEYTIRAKNAGGCMAEDKVSVFATCNNSNIFVPNTFSPNGDGANDIFYPRGSGVFRILDLKVFNRWGQVVFEKANFNANDASAGWDGTFKGKQLAPDVFVYMLQVVCDNNTTLTFKGNIALLR
ncbi:MAG: PKD domain-containing protein [Ginsengibacter sp.]